MHVGMVLVAVLLWCRALIRFGIWDLVLAFVASGMLISVHIVYKMRDPHMIRHRSRVYYRGPGTEVRVRYSRFVPTNCCVEMFADDCHVASLYRGNEVVVPIPPGTGRIIFMFEDIRIGEFSPAGDGCFYIHSENRVPLNLNPSVMETDSFRDIDEESEEEPYRAVCRILAREKWSDLIWSWLCLLGRTAGRGSRFFHGANRCGYVWRYHTSINIQRFEGLDGCARLLDGNAGISEGAIVR